MSAPRHHHGREGLPTMTEQLRKFLNKNSHLFSPTKDGIWPLRAGGGRSEQAFWAHVCVGALSFVLLARGRLRKRAPKPLPDAAGLGAWVALLTILLNSPFTRGCVRVTRGSCPAAGAGGQPPYGRIIHRIRKLSRSGTPGWPDGRRERRPFLSSRLAAPSAQPPDQLCAGHWPGHSRSSTQHGGSDHRRPSNVETGTPLPPPLPPPTPPENNKESSRKLCSSLHRGLLGR